MRILMVTPHATEVHVGGAEVAARRLMDALTAHGHEVWELGGLPQAFPMHSTITALGTHRVAVREAYSDEMRFISRREPWETEALEGWLLGLAPDVVHFHHFIGPGSDLVFLVRRCLPSAKIVFTLHEFLMWCARDGKMVTDEGKLCNGAAPSLCAKCTGVPENDLFFRDNFFRSLISASDTVTSPSEFLASRFRKWSGSASAKVSVIANVPPSSSRAIGRGRELGEARSSIGFFGQIIPQKGLHILLDALIVMRRQKRNRATLEIYGTRPDMQYWTSEIEPRLTHLNRGRVRASYRGPFEHDHVGQLMQLVDWIAVPSTWWENAPTVIYEAASAGRPVLAGDIGGMREAVETLRCGRLVAAGSIGEWADLLSHVTSSPGEAEWDEIVQRMALVPSAADVAVRYLSIYSSESSP